MLLRITDFPDLDTCKLMQIYSESNLENTDYFYPDEADKKVAVAKVEEGFLTFLKNEFFNMSNATYWVLESDGVWLSALRTCLIKDRLFYLEALETRPDSRQKGCGSLILSSVLQAMKSQGTFKICDCVSKKNVASLKTHEKCGFKIVSDSGYNYLYNETDEYEFGLEFNYTCK